MLKKVFKPLSILLCFSLISSLLMISFPGDISASTSPSYYVSPTGSDSNPGTLAQPFLTIQKARDTVRTLNSAMTDGIHIYLRGGTYTLDSAVAFTEADSGTNGNNITYQNYQNETPIISGGIPVSNSGFWDQGNGIYVKSVSLSNFRQMYVNGVRADRAHSAGTYTANSWHYDSNNVIDGYIVNNSVIGNYYDADDVEMVWSAGSRNHRLSVSSIIDNGNGTQTILMNQPNLSWALSMEGSDKPDYNSPFSIENAYELLDQPGEWYYDQIQHYLYYKPRAGENISTVDITVSNAENLFTFQGSSLTAQVHNIVIKGLTFEHTSWMRPSTEGASSLQAGFMIAGTNQTSATDNGITPPAAIQINHANHILLDSSSFTHLGAAGVKMENDVQDSQVINSQFHDISADAVIVGTVKHKYLDPGAGEGLCTNIVIRNNVISNVSNEYSATPAVTVYYGKLIDISYNDIGSIPASGIFMGWGTSEQDTFSLGNNRITHNKIADFMNKNTDGGGIYTVGMQPGTVIENNYIKDMHNSGGALNMGEGSGYMTVRNNVVENVGTSYWLNLAGATVSHILVDNNYTTTSSINNTAYKSPVSNTQYYPGANWPAGAWDIMYHAGFTTTSYVKLAPNTVPTGNLAYRKNSYAYYLDGSPATMQTGSDPWRAVDGYIDSYSQAAGQYAWRQVVDLGSATTINRVVVKFPTTPKAMETLYATDYYIKVSTNGSSYTTAATVNGSAGGNVETFFAAASARYVMIEAIAPNSASQAGGQMAISELEVYAPAFTPPTNANLKLWLSADAAVTKDGSNYVSAWGDLSGTGNHAVQSNSSNKPLYVENAINGKPVLRFDGANDYLTAAGVAGSMSSFSVIYVIKPKNLGINQIIGAAGSWGQFSMHSGDADGGAYAGTDVSTRLTPTETGSGIYTANTAQMLEFTYSSGSGKLYKNGVLKSTKAMGAPASWTGFNLGENGAGTINGDIAEVLVYNTALSDANRQSVEAYLKNKYLQPFTTLSDAFSAPAGSNFGFTSGYTPKNALTHYTVAAPVNSNSDDMTQAWFDVGNNNLISSLNANGLVEYSSVRGTLNEQSKVSPQDSQWYTGGQWTFTLHEGGQSAALASMSNPALDIVDNTFFKWKYPTFNNLDTQMFTFAPLKTADPLDEQPRALIMMVNIKNSGSVTKTGTLSVPSFLTHADNVSDGMAKATLYGQPPSPPPNTQNALYNSPPRFADAGPAIAGYEAVMGLDDTSLSSNPTSQDVAFSLAAGESKVLTFAFLVGSDPTELAYTRDFVQTQSALQWLNTTASIHKAATGNLVIPSDPMIVDMFNRYYEASFNSYVRNGAGWLEIPNGGGSWSIMSLLSPGYLVGQIQNGDLWMPDNISESLVKSTLTLKIAADYYQGSGDTAFFANPAFEANAKQAISAILGTKYSTVNLFPSTELWASPSRGDYHTGSNILVWRCLDVFSRIARDVWNEPATASNWAAEAAAIKASILSNTVITGPYGSQFAEGTKISGVIDNDVKSHDPEEVTLIKAPLYGFLQQDNTLLTNNFKASMSSFNYLYKPAIDGIQWEGNGNWQGGVSAPGWLNQIGGATTKSEMLSALERWKTLTDVDGSMWWWPYDPDQTNPAVVDRRIAKAAEGLYWDNAKGDIAGSEFNTLLINNILGLSADASLKTVSFRPISPWNSFSWTNGHIGNANFDITYSETSNSITAVITNRNATNYTASVELTVPEGKALSGATPTGSRYGRNSLITTSTLAPNASATLTINF